MFSKMKKGEFKMPKVNWKIIDQHEQIYKKSCVASAIEMILKLEKKVAINYTGLQYELKDRAIGFGDFNNKTILGLTFESKFGSYDNFDFVALFNFIDKELVEERFVVVSLGNDTCSSCHMFIIYEKSEEGKYFAFTKESKEGELPAKITKEEQNAKEIIKKMNNGKGTDILIYKRF